MTRHEKWNCFLWMLGTAACVVWALALLGGFLGCVRGQSQPDVLADEKAQACAAIMAFVILNSSSCTEAQLRVDALLRSPGVCLDFYGPPDAGGGVDVCALLNPQDGAPYAHRDH